MRAQWPIGGGGHLAMATSEILNTICHWISMTMFIEYGAVTDHLINISVFIIVQHSHCINMHKGILTFYLKKQRMDSHRTASSSSSFIL